MKATKQSHDWHCHNHDTYGWRGEECKLCKVAPSEVEQLVFRNERLVADYASLQEELSTIRRIHAQNIAIKDAEIARWKTVPMKYRRMEFNAQLQFEIAEQRADHMKLVEENHELRQQLAASQLEAKRLREALEASDNLLRDLPTIGGFYGLSVVENNEQALSSPTSTEALDAYVAEKVEQLKSELASEKQDYLDCEHMLHSERDTWQNKISELTRQRDLAVSAATKARNQAQQCALVCSKKLDVYRALMNMIDVTDDALAAIKESEV